MGGAIEEMSRAARAIRDASKLYGAQVIAAAFAIVFSAWLARNLPSAELSLWPICIVLAAFVEVIGSMGMGNLFVRVIPSLIERNRTQEVAAMLRVGLAINLGVALLVSLVLLSNAERAARFFRLEGQVETSVIRLLIWAIFFTAAYKLVERALYAVQEFDKIAAIRFGFTVLRPSAAVGFYVVTGIRGAILALSLVTLAATGAAILSLWRHVRVGGGTLRPWHVLKGALPFYPASLINVGTQRLDYLIVGGLTNPAALATYYVARKLPEYLGQLDTCVIEAITPKLSEQRHLGKRAFERGFMRCSRYLVLGLLPLHIGLAAIAPPFVDLYAGGNYPTAAPIMSLLSLGLFVSLMAQFYRAYVIVICNRWHLSLIDAAGSLTSVGLGVPLVIWWSGLGVALSQFAAYVLQVFLGILLLKAVLVARHDAKAIRVAILANVLLIGTAVALQILMPSLWSMPVIIIAGIAAYLLALRKRLTVEDISLTRQLLPAWVVSTEWGARLVEAISDIFCQPSAPSTEAHSRQGRCRT